MVFNGEGLHLTKTVDLHGEAVWLCRWPASPLRVVVGCPRSVDLAGALFIEVWAKFWDPGGSRVLVVHESMAVVLSVL
ncbi:hypothetical protein ISN44_As10g015280 [Arabidopsis suecica]|uniref:Uncharacterized protein n=1 Tax=Arabidopsis suecica TaxID=45249 RepID=A0A8T1ZVQ3_ARASU|nr:hypothetical protein ISN44_As10g015280 [Arabidopsis suecica]